MESISFYKMNGSGNDFIILDNRTGGLDTYRNPSFVRAVCTRKRSVGADGLIFIENSQDHDFSWRFFNADGSEAEMCGNGGRCAARYAVLRGIAGPTLSFETASGTIHAEVKQERVKVRLPVPGNAQIDRSLNIEGTHVTTHCINTGVPHAVVFVDDCETADVLGLGSRIRRHPMFHPSGTNVNFVSQGGPNMLHIRTYERGVEDETFACGTGSAAAALIAVMLGKADSPVSIKTRGGEMLTVYSETSAPPFTQVFLEGGTCLVCCGELFEESVAPIR